MRTEMQASDQPRQDPNAGQPSPCLYTVNAHGSTARVLVLLTPFLLAACTTAVQVATGKVAEIALSAIGIKTPESANTPRPPKVIALRIEAAKDMNAGDDGEGLSTVLRLYKLKDQTNFLATPYSAFGNPDKEKQTIGADLLDVREMTLSPGQVLDLKEKMIPEATYLGVVALFRSPAAQRWRFAYATSDVESGVTIGVHACAMTSTNAAPSGMTVAETALLSPVRCK
jgi:type VI secretion system protein VasD